MTTSAEQMRAWIAAFAGFALVYWPILARPKTERRHPMKAA